MTALAGYWSFDGRAEPSDSCGAMLQALKPFGSITAQATNGYIAMGRRLYPLLPEDIHDRQPLADDAGQLLFTADVRLDNRREIADALLVAKDAASLSDADLLFLTLRRWGVEGLLKVVGDFAFALFDRAEDHLILGRDPLGQRPLFWHRGSSFLAFASMPQGLHALQEIPKRADVGTLGRFAVMLPQRGSNSFYEGIQRVLPGHVVTISRATCRTHRYWDPRRSIPRRRTFEDYVEEYRYLLDDAVASRLRTNGREIASQLSAGWDSNAVTATAARILASQGKTLLAFTATPKAGLVHAAPFKRFADEGPMSAHTPAKYPNITHYLLESSGESPLEGFDRHAAFFGRPAYNACNQVWLAQIRTAAAARGASVVLVGDMGNWTISASPNTVLADYVRQMRLGEWWREARTMYGQGRARLRGVAASSFGPWMPNALWNLLKPLSVTSSLQSIWILRSSADGLRREHESREARFRKASRDHSGLAAQIFLEADFGEYRKGVLGAWGVDERDPTADRRLIEFSLSLPAEMLLSGGTRRPLAQTALSDRVPPEILAEKRRGYQGAGWLESLHDDRAGLTLLLEQIAADKEASDLLDIERLQHLIETLPTAGDDARTVEQYRGALLRGLAAGHFLLGQNGRPT